MAEQRVQRRLVAIVMADVVGYSRLMEMDEAGTLATLKERRKVIVAPVVRAHDGRMVKVMGDGVLIEFTSAVNAVAAAMELQEKMARANEELPEASHIVLRIGINLGDVIGEGGDIYGDGVNIAARLETLAQPGGVCISAKVYDEVHGKIEFAANDMGEVELKNIAKPVRAYRIATGATAAPPISIPDRSDKPSIAVLPFDNMSGDPSQGYFSDGITENIITNLSRFRDLAVIARNSSFAYKGKSPNVSLVSRELGASFVLEGSVQRAGATVRITAQLIEGATGRHLWADRYDRNVEDIFAVQDEVTETIVGTLASAYGGRLRKAWEGRKQAGGGRNFRAFDCFLRGLQSFDHFTKEDVARARGHFLEAIDIDPGYAKAHAKLAWTYMVDVGFGWTDSPEDSLASALDSANKSIAHDDDEAWGHWALAGYHVNTGQHDLALAEFDRAFALNPNDADVMTDMAWCLSYSGRARDGLDLANKAMRLNPHYPEWYVAQRGAIYFDAERYADAIATLEKLRSIDTISVRLYLAASHAALGHSADALKAVQRVLEMDPQATVARCTSPAMAPYKEPRGVEHFRDNLRKAGLPA
jgi:adenylate cyclase